MGQIIPVSQVLRYWGNLGKLGLNTPNHVQGHLKSNPKSSAPWVTSNGTLLQHIIVLCGSSYTCFRGTWVLEQFGETGGLNTPNHVEGHLKSNPKASAPCFTSSETLLQCHCTLWIELYLFHRCSGIGAIWGNWAQIPQITCWEGHMKSNPKSLAFYFTSNETLLQCQGPLWVELYLFSRYSGIGAIWGSWARIPQIMHRDT